MTVIIQLDGKYLKLLYGVFQKESARPFLRLIYIDITKHTYTQSGTVKEMITQEKCGLRMVPQSVSV
jgi:hypothetical protein